MHQAFDNRLQYYSPDRSSSRIQQQPPLSPRSALRSLQEPPSPRGHAPKHRRDRLSSSGGDGHAPVPALPLPPRKSSLVASRHLPLPNQPMLEDGHYLAASPAHSPSLLDNSSSSSNWPSSAQPSPSVAPHARLPHAPRASYGGPQLQQLSSTTPSLPHRHSYSSMSARSVPSVSDGSSVLSIPVSTPDEHGHLYHHPTPVYHSRAPSPFHQEHSRDDNPFAYSVEVVEPSTASSSRSSLPYIESSQRQVYGGHSTTHPWPRASFHGMTYSPKRGQPQPSLQRPARSVDDYLHTVGPGAAPGAPASRIAAPRPSLPVDTSAYSAGGFDGRVMAPIRQSSSSMSHRSSLPSMVSSDSRTSSAMSIHRLSHPSPTSSSPRESTASAEESGDLPHNHFSFLDAPSKRARGWTASTNYTQPPSYNQRLEVQRRSKSAERPKATALHGRRSPPSSWSSSSSSAASSPLASKKLDHAEVMAKLNRKMKERIAAKKASATATAASASGLAAAAAVVGGGIAAAAAGRASVAGASSSSSPSFSVRKYRGDSVSSSIPGTPLTSTTSMGSPYVAPLGPPHAAASATRRPASSSSMEEEGSEGASAPPPPPPRGNPIGIESLLSAAAINDGAQGGVVH